MVTPRNLTKSGVEGVYPAALEALNDVIQKCEIYDAYCSTYGDNSATSLYPTLGIKDQTYNGNTESFFDSDGIISITPNNVCLHNIVLTK